MKKIETKLAQLGNRTDKVTGAIVTPIYLSTAYAHPGLGESTGYDYTRTYRRSGLLISKFAL